MERGADAFCLEVFQGKQKPRNVSAPGLFWILRSVNLLSSVVVVPHALQAFFDL